MSISSTNNYNAMNASENITIPESESLRRELHPRQLAMIAIGGAIGTGLFLASGNSIAIAGPGGALLAYVIIGIMVYFLMTSLGEMAAFTPTSGSFYTYAARYVDPALGFALGCNYWYNWAITVAAEIVAAGTIMQYWFPHVQPAVWSVTFLCLFVMLNILSVKGFGEAEYWFSLIKVIVVIAFIIIGTCMIFGFFDNHHFVGFSNWTIGDAPFHGGWLTTVSVFMMAGYSFQGTELVGIAAGEAKEPGKSIPRAIRLVFWRILLFYVLALVIISFLVPYNAPDLSNSSDVTISPFTMVFKHAGLVSAASFMNFVILIAILSAGNSGLYASTRMLWYLAKKGHVPKVFAKIDKRGVPVNALLITTAIGMIAFLSSLYGNAVYIWLLNASSLTGFIAWAGIAISHYRFRKAYVQQGHDLKRLPYRAKAYPYAPVIALCLCLVIIAGQNYTALMGQHIDWKGLMITYVGLVIFIVLYLYYKWKHKTHVIPLDECPFDFSHAKPALSSDI